MIRALWSWLLAGWRRLWGDPRGLILEQRSSAWPRVRAQHLRHEPVCQACGRSKDVEVHHVIPVSVDPTKELDLNNLITLCASPCHFTFGHLLSYHCYNESVRDDVRLFRHMFAKRRCK